MMRKEVICIEKMVRAADGPGMREALESGVEETLGLSVFMVRSGYPC